MSFPIWGHNFLQSLLPLESVCLCHIWWKSDHFHAYEASFPVYGSLPDPRGYFRFCDVTFGFGMSLPVLGCHFRFWDVTSNVIIFFPISRYISVPSLVAIGLFPWLWGLTSCLEGANSWQNRSLPVLLCHLLCHFILALVTLHVST